jgi:hypothetical protein
MLRRVIENITVAVVASLVTWAMSNRGDAAGAIDSGIDRVLTGVALYGSPLHGWLWLAAVVLAVAGISLQGRSMAPPCRNVSWEWSLSMPSVPTTLIGVGVAMGLIAEAVVLAQAASLWVLPFLAVDAYWSYRWMAGLRHRWTRMGGAL